MTAATSSCSTLVVRAADQQEYWFDEGCHITEWLNTDADPALSVARARVPAGSTTRWHRLADTVERYVILAGRGRVELRRAAAVTGAAAAGSSEATPMAPQPTPGLPFEAELLPGDVVVIPAATDQRITNLGQADLVFLALCTPRFRANAYQDTESPGAGASDADPDDGKRPLG